MYRKIRCIIIDCIVIQDVNKLRKRITIVAGLLMILVLLFVAIQNKREPEVINSRSVGTANYSEEHINIALNKLYASDYGEIAEDLVKKCRENSFQPEIQLRYQEAECALRNRIFKSLLLRKRGRSVFFCVYPAGDRRRLQHHRQPGALHP